MLTELLTYGFFQRALLGGVIIGALAPMIGIFFVARKQAFFADTLAHASLLGVAVGIVLGVQNVWSAVLGALVATLGMEWLRKRSLLSGDAALALVLSGSLAGAVLVLSMTNTWNAQVLSYLFGSVTTVAWGDVLGMGVIALAIAVAMFFARDHLFLMVSDARLAKVQGLPIERYELLFAMLSALVVAVGMRIVGALLVSALMIIPVLGANMWGRGFWHTAGIASGYGVASVICGLFLSAALDVSAGASVVLVSIALFAGTVLVRKT